MINQSTLVSQVKSNHIRRNLEYNNYQMSESFGHWLLAARKAAKQSQLETAKRASVSKAYIGHLENNRPHSVTGAKLAPTREKVIAIAKAVGGDIDKALKLCGYAPEKTEQLPPFMYEIDFSRFSETDLKEIESFIRFKLQNVQPIAQNRIIETFVSGTIRADDENDRLRKVS